MHAREPGSLVLLGVLLGAGGVLLGAGGVLQRAGLRSAWIGEGLALLTVVSKLPAERAAGLPQARVARDAREAATTNSISTLRQPVPIHK